MYVWRAGNQANTLRNYLGGGGRDGRKRERKNALEGVRNRNEGGEMKEMERQLSQGIADVK